MKRTRIFSQVFTAAAMAMVWVAANLAQADTIVFTDFDGQTISGNTATPTWIVNGVADPSSISAIAGASTPNLFTTSDAQDTFAPAFNTGNSSNPWSTSVDLTVLAGSAVSLIDVTFDYRSFNNGGANQSAGRLTDFRITLFNPDGVSVGTSEFADASDGATPDAIGTPVSLEFASAIDLSDLGTYRLTIEAGDLGLGANLIGNNSGIDNLSINDTVSAMGIAVINISLKGHVREMTHSKWHGVA